MYKYDFIVDVYIRNVLQCCFVLYCMSEDLLSAWNRSSLRFGYKSRLGNPIKFMLSEFEGEQRIGLSAISQVLGLITIITSQRAV